MGLVVRHKEIMLHLKKYIGLVVSTLKETFKDNGTGWIWSIGSTDIKSDHWSKTYSCNVYLVLGVPWRIFFNNWLKLVTEQLSFFVKEYFDF